MNPTLEILERIRKSSEGHENGVFTRLYRYLLREDVYYEAYKNLYANDGASTKGVDDDTADGFSEQYIQEIITSLKNLEYTPKPVRRTHISKKNGKLRPLGIPSFKDKLVQDVIRQILQAIYEPIFSDKSHGFRPKRSCHTALMQISREFRSVRWFVEGDIKGCFDNINHEVLLEILSRKIKDSKFINLIGRFLKAGYIQDWKYNVTYSGCPQGGILSPILANIYMNELDKKVLLIKKEFDKEPERAYSKAYSEINQKIKPYEKLLKENPDNPNRGEWIEAIRQLKIERRKLPYKDASDKKISYVRYADDFIVGVSGTKEECVQIKSELKQFLNNELRLELSEEKTKITHSSECARFLSYDICIRRNQEAKKKTNGVVQRTLNNSVEMLVPLKDKIESFMFNRDIVIQGKNGELVPKQRNAMVSLSDLEVVDTYNSQTRGLCNYYSLASNFGQLFYFTYLMEYSCLKTLAKKHDGTIAKIKKMYGFEKTWGVPYETKSGKKRMCIVKFVDLKKKSGFDKNIDNITHKIHYGNVNSFEDRLKAKKCELCGKEENTKFEIHHINKLKNLKGKEQWEKTMIARKRKTLVVCKECHINIHHPK